MKKINLILSVLIFTLGFTYSPVKADRDDAAIFLIIVGSALVTGIIYLIANYEKQPESTAQYLAKQRIKYAAQDLMEQQNFAKEKVPQVLAKIDNLQMPNTQDLKNLVKSINEVNGDLSSSAKMQNVFDDFAKNVDKLISKYSDQGITRNDIVEKILTFKDAGGNTIVKNPRTVDQLGDYLRFPEKLKSKISFERNKPFEWPKPLQDKGANVRNESSPSETTDAKEAVGNVKPFEGQSQEFETGTTQENPFGETKIAQEVDVISPPGGLASGLTRPEQVPAPAPTVEYEYKPAFEV